MSWAMAIGAVVSGTGAIIKSNQAKEAGNKARIKAEAAQRELDEQKDRFKGLDTSNPYLNMENVFEDLTIDTRAAEFQREQQMMTQANTMQQLRGAAGGSGIAALAQTLVSQGSIDAQKTQANIAQQEQANRMQERAESARIQGLEREGELISRQAQHGKISALMGMAADDVSVQRESERLAMVQQQQAQQQMIGAAAQGAMGAAAGISQQGIGGWKKGDPSLGKRIGGGKKIDAQMFEDYKAMTGMGGVGGSDAQMFAMFKKFMESQNAL
jgi:hypothetical protein